MKSLGEREMSVRVGLDNDCWLAASAGGGHRSKTDPLSQRHSLCQSESGGLDLLQEVPVSLSVLDTSDGHLLLDLGQVLRLVGVKVSGRHGAVFDRISLGLGRMMGAVRREAKPEGQSDK